MVLGKTPKALKVGKGARKKVVEDNGKDNGKETDKEKSAKTWTEQLDNGVGVKDGVKDGVAPFHEARTTDAGVNEAGATGTGAHGAGVEPTSSESDAPARRMECVERGGSQSVGGRVGAVACHQSSVVCAARVIRCA